MYNAHISTPASPPTPDAATTPPANSAFAVVPEASAVATTKPGDRIALDPHVIVCGDGTLAADVAHVMGDERAALVFADLPRPPADVDDLTALLVYENAVAAFHPCLASGASVYLWCEPRQYPLLASAFGAVLSHVSTIASYRADAGAGAPYRAGFDLAVFGHADSRVREWHGAHGESNAWSASTDEERAKRVLLNSSRTGDVALDPFGDSGAMLFAADAIGRRARVIVCEPRACDAIITRWEAMSGRTAVRTCV